MQLFLNYDKSFKWIAIHSVVMLCPEVGVMCAGCAGRCARHGTPLPRSHLIPGVKAAPSARVAETQGRSEVEAQHTR